MCVWVCVYVGGGGGGGDFSKMYVTTVAMSRVLSVYMYQEHITFTSGAALYIMLSCSQPTVPVL